MAAEPTVAEQEKLHALQLAWLVEKKAYGAYVKAGTGGGRARRVWTEAILDLRGVGGSPIRIREMLTTVGVPSVDPMNPGAPGSLLDREARRMLSSIEDRIRAKRPSTTRAATAARKEADMATEVKAGETLEIEVPEGTCGDGCGEPVSGKRSYKQGHDARLRGILGRAFKAGAKIGLTENGSRHVYEPKVLMERHGFPIPTIKAPKPKAAPKAASAKSTAKAPAKAAAKRTRRKRS